MNNIYSFWTFTFYETGKEKKRWSKGAPITNPYPLTSTDVLNKLESSKELVITQDKEKQLAGMHFTNSCRSLICKIISKFLPHKPRWWSSNILARIFLYMYSFRYKWWLCCGEIQLNLALWYVFDTWKVSSSMYCADNATTWRVKIYTCFLIRYEMK